MLTLHGFHSYPGAILPGWILIGIGGGLTVPTITGSATADRKKEPELLMGERAGSVNFCGH